MKITTGATPPTAARVRHNYEDVITALKGNTDWISVPLNEIAGRTKAQAQTTIHAACDRAGIPIETRTSDAVLFIRRLNSTEVIDARQ